MDIERIRAFEIENGPVIDPEEMHNQNRIARLIRLSLCIGYQMGNAFYLATAYILFDTVL